MQKPHIRHWEATLHVVPYLKYCLGQGIFFKSSNNLRLTASYEVDCATLTCRSVTGYFIFLADSPLSWKNKKHHTFRSFETAKYRSMIVTCYELKGLHLLLYALHGL